MATWLERYRNPIIIALAALLAAAIVYIVLDGRSSPQPLEIRFGEPTPGAGGPIEVYITGAVARPGVYELTDGDRVVDALYEAGGPAPDANLEAVNLAKILRDEDMVVVPRLGQASSDVAGVVSGSPLDINAAPAEELATLPGIGEAYSQAIVASRTADGLFATTDDLVERRLIPGATYERIRELITVGP